MNVYGPMSDPPRVAIYARVSTADHGQDPNSQIRELETYAQNRGWEIVGEYVDLASAADFRRRSEWRRLLQEADRRTFDLVLVWKLDRAFRSTLHALNALRHFERRRVGFICATQPIDTTSSSGRLLFTILAAFAEIERDLIAERTKAGMERARREGKHVGRPAGSSDRRRRTRRSPTEIAAARILERRDLEEAAV